MCIDRSSSRQILSSNGSTFLASFSANYNQQKMIAIKILILACLVAVAFSQCIPSSSLQNCITSLTTNPDQATFCRSCASELSAYFRACDPTGSGISTLNQLCPGSGSPSTHSFSLALVMVVPAAIAALF